MAIAEEKNVVSRQLERDHRILTGENHLDLINVTVVLEEL